MRTDAGRIGPGTSADADAFQLKRLRKKVEEAEL
jgi:hypothetical protein